MNCFSLVAGILAVGAQLAYSLPLLPLDAKGSQFTTAPLTRTSGRVSLSDSGNDRVHKDTPEGIPNTIAGTGTAGFSGDGTTSTAAQLNNPVGVALDSVVYV